MKVAGIYNDYGHSSFSFYNGVLLTSPALFLNGGVSDIITKLRGKILRSGPRNETQLRASRAGNCESAFNVPHISDRVSIEIYFYSPSDCSHERERERSETTAIIRDIGLRGKKHACSSRRRGLSRFSLR